MRSSDEAFLAILREKQVELYRDMPWRRDTRGYYVLVSELMLQQTQVERVVPKFEQFILAFPDFESLAQAPLADVLTLWSGLGYNRRAKFLHESAKQIVAQHNAVLPPTRDQLVALPGVGVNTAGALLAYVYNQPVVFIETNIRTVLLYHFFEGERDVDDAHLREVLERVIDEENPREFYWAMMDYGSWLKRSGIKNIQASRQYRKQSPLKGSVREIRGKIIKHLANESPLTTRELQSRIDTGDGRYELAYNQLVKEGLVEQVGTDQVRLTN